MLMVILKKWFFPRSIPDDSRSPFHKLADNIVCRAVNYVDTIWRYILVTALLVCLMEFVGGRIHGANGEMAVAVVTVVAGIVWCVFA